MMWTPYFRQNWTASEVRAWAQTRRLRCLATWQTAATSSSVITVVSPLP